MLQNSSQTMIRPMAARPTYSARSESPQLERWSRRRTLAFVVVTNGAVWAMLAWSIAVMMHR